MRTLLLTGAAFGCLMMGPLSARADTPLYPFSRSGSSGILVGGDEYWNYGGPSPPGTTDIYWGTGIPGGVGHFDETTAATDFEITFTNGILDPNQFSNGQGCGGGSTGGDVFCANGQQWFATMVGTNGIVFDAPAGDSLAIGQPYFVNIFLNPGTGVANGAFAGAWSIASIPEPASLAMLAAGLFALPWLRRRRR